VEAREAIRVAKTYVADIFEDEGVFDIGLEEIVAEDDGDWNVTVGFSRRWDRPQRSVFDATPLVPERRAEHRTYKVVHVDDRTGRVVEVRNHPDLT
jgi:hypothetical protein